MTDHRRPLSWVQRRHLAWQRANPGSPRANVTGAVALDGRLDAAALERALTRVTARHESLRARYPDLDRAIVADPAPVALVVVDLGDLPVRVRNAVARELRRRVHARPFDPGAGPPWRTALLRLAPDRHQLVSCHHHVGFDAASSRIFLRDLAAAYRDHVRGTAPDEGVAPGPFRAAPPAAEGEAERESARAVLTRLEGCEPLFPEPGPAPGERPTVRRNTAPAAVAARLRAWIGARRTTPFVGVFAVYALALARLTGRATFAVATSVSRRPPGAETVLGCFADVVLVRCDVRSEDSLERAHDAVRDAVRWSTAHAHVPLLLLEALAGGRLPVDAGIAVHRREALPGGLPGLTLGPLPVDRNLPWAPLFLSVEEAEGGIDFTWYADPARVPPEVPLALWKRVWAILEHEIA